jgi:hypothetical protein
MSRIALPKCRAEDRATIPRPPRPRRPPDPMAEIRVAAESDVWSSDDPARIRMAVDTLLALNDR